MRKGAGLTSDLGTSPARSWGTQLGSHTREAALCTCTVLVACCPHWL